MAKFRLSKKLQIIIKESPNSPGVYRMLDEEKRVIYVGKAKAIRKRLQGHFRITKGMSSKNMKMIEKVRDIAYTEVKTELDALILETNFIKELRPKYNVLMRDDKSHSYLKITIKDDFPRIYAVRNAVADGSLYFGPYTSTDPISRMHKVFRKIFPYRSCDLKIDEKTPGKVEVRPKGRRLPCLDYYIKRCGAPCVGYVEKKDYSEIIDKVINFLKGKSAELIAEIKIEMQELAENKQFEKAAVLRDNIKGLERLLEKQGIVSTDFVDADVIGIAKNVGRYAVTILKIRYGKVVGQENFLMQYLFEEEDDEIVVLISFLTQYYPKALDWPSSILMPSALKEGNLVASYLNKLSPSGKKIKLIAPQKGKKMDLVKLAKKNALSFLEQTKARWMTDKAKTVEAAKGLAGHLGIDRELKRIECYDISHIQGTETVGSMVVFTKGVPDRSQYRRFKVKELKRGEVDDFASLMEVLERRLKYLVEEKSRLKKDEKFKVWPDLIILDGGKGQLSSVMKIVKKLKLEKSLEVIALAKKEEEVFVPGKKEAVWLPLESNERYLIQRIRDEAHRFAISFHQVLRRKRMVKSVLDDVPGLGPKNKKKLIHTFGSVSGIKKASLEELTKVCGDKIAKSLKERL